MTDEPPQFSISNLLAAIEATSADLAARGERITALEATNYRLQEENDELRTQLGALFQRVKAIKADLEAATQSADRAEADAAANLVRANRLQDELVAANDDIANISSAVSNLLVQNEIRR